MSPYFLTLSFLLLMSFLSSSEMIRLSGQALGIKLHRAARETQEEMQELKARSLLEDFRCSGTQQDQTDMERDRRTTPSSPRTTPLRSASLRFNLARPPNNARLNFYFVLLEEPEKLPLGFSYYETAARLLRILYSNSRAFQSVASAEYRILNQLREKKELLATSLFPDDLGSIILDDPTLNALFHRMLLGDDTMVSLLHFISFNPITSSRVEAGRINLLFAPDEVLHAALPNLVLVEEILKIRSRLLQEIITQENERLHRPKTECKTRTDFKMQFKTAVEPLLNAAHLEAEAYRKVLDYGLGQMGSILFITDPKTGLVSRQKHISPSS